MTWETDSPSSPHRWQHDMQTEGRITRLEVTAEDHTEQLESHETRHDTQDVWNRGFTIALAGLSAGLAHAKANDVLSLALEFLQRLKS